MDAQRITRALGGIWRGHYGLAFCPAHSNTRTPALSLKNTEDGRLLIYCFAGCDFAAISDALKGLGLIAGARHGYSSSQTEVNRVRAKQKAAVEKRALQAHRLWKEALPIKNTIAETYLRARAITAELSDTLRFHPAAWYSPSAKQLPALVALVEGAPSFAVHRTYLATDGQSKASVEGNKMMLGSTAGGAVRLAEANGPLVVAEGIETALSCASGLLHVHATIWAALSSSGMAALVLPSKPHRLTIATDGDEAGQHAGQKLAARAHALGWCVSILSAPNGKDWNDILIMKGRAL